MPTLSVRFQAQIPSGLVLAKEGPKVPVELRIPKELEGLLQQENKPIPAPLTGLGLIDTGASATMIDQDAVSLLCVSPVGMVNLITPAGPSQSPLYPVRLAIVVPGNPPLLAASLASAAAGPLKAQGLLCLIGRDILQRAILVYNGTDGSVSIAF